MGWWLLVAALLSVSAGAAGSSVSAPLVGADVELATLSAQDQVAELSRLARSGVRSVRFWLDWNRVEPSPGSFTWAADDAAVNAALGQGLEVVLVLGPCAEWAVDPAQEVPADQRRYGVPKDAAQWQRYVQEAVSHFRGRVRYWQVRQQPNIRNFRGTRGEFLKLLAAAADAARAADLESCIVAPESGSLDVAEIARLAASEAWDLFDVLGVYVDRRPGGLSALSLPWSVLNSEVLPDLPAGRVSSHPTWVLGSSSALSADEWLQRYLLAWVFGAERCYLPAGAISSEWTQQLAGAELTGYLGLGPDVWAVASRGDEGPFAVVWASEEVTVPASRIAPVVRPQEAAQAARLGGAPGSSAAVEGEALSFRVGPRPVLITGLDLAGARPLPITRGDVLAARPGLDVGNVPVVYADWSMEQRPEFGLAHAALRRLPGGEVADEDRAGRRCVRTRMRPSTAAGELDNPWIYFDVDDRWLYFDQGKTSVAITVECEGSFLGEHKLGFNIMYDSTSGYRFTPWQWVEAGGGWRRYRFQLNDVSFTNRDGYDFRINAKGSKQDLWVASVTLEKVALPPMSGATAGKGDGGVAGPCLAEAWEGVR